MHEVDELIITEHQNKSLKCEVKPVEPFHKLRTGSPELAFNSYGVIEV